MKITVHIKDVSELAEARDAVLMEAGEGDEIEIVIGQVLTAPAERQLGRPAGGLPANQKG